MKKKNLHSSVVKIGFHDAVVNGQKCKIYPDSGASGTIVPKHLVKNTKPGCKNVWTVLSGNNHEFTRHRVPVTFNGMTKNIVVSASNTKNNVAWVGYPHLIQFGVKKIDITSSTGNYKMIKPMKKIKC